MPTFLDVVTLGLSAGLSFDASLELYCKRYDTDLSKTMRGTLQLWRIGVKSRAEALEEMARELDVPAMTRFVATVSEALAFGTPLAETLERQAQVIREEQRAQMEEEVEKVPVKMLIPLGTLIVPAMLLAILGPLLGPALGLA
jgi:tight adherence protein C